MHWLHSRDEVLSGKIPSGNMRGGFPQTAPSITHHLHYVLLTSICPLEYPQDWFPWLLLGGVKAVAGPDCAEMAAMTVSQMVYGAGRPVRCSRLNDEYPVVK